MKKKLILAVCIMLILIFSFFIPKIYDYTIQLPHEHEPEQEYKYVLSQIYELTIDTDEPKNDFDVAIAIYDNKLYASWTTIKDRDNYKITLKSISENSNEMINITPEWSIGFNGFSKLVSYNDKLYITWVSNSVMNRTDFDIVCRTYNITTEHLSAIESLGFPYGYKVLELFHDVIVFNDMLYAVWSVRGMTTPGNYVSDIVIQSSNGTSWGELKTELLPFGLLRCEYVNTIVYDDKIYVLFSCMVATNKYEIGVLLFDNETNPLYLMKTESENSIDSWPFATVYKDKLYVFSSTNDNTITNGSDYDIVMRCFNESGLLYTQEITGLDNNGDDFAPYALVYDDKLFVTWTSNDITITNDSDLDIVYKYYDGTNWSETKEITLPNDIGDDRCSKMIVYNDNLYFFWESNSIYTTDSDYDIIYRILTKKFLHV